MKKLSILVLLLAGVVVAWYVLKTPQNSGQSLSPAQAALNTTNNNSVASGSGSLNAPIGEDAEGLPVEEGDDDGLSDPQERPATEIYKTADEALKAVREGATRYDDLILEQFTQPGADCSWCPQFYDALKDSMNAPGISNDQKSYFAELLAISGRVGNVAALVDSIEKSPAGGTGDILSEALEMTVGKEDVVKYLETKLNTPKAELRESIVAAIANQGTAASVEALYKNAVESKNPDGFYSAGTGLGEVIPDPEAYPELKEIVGKRDDYSHLAVKSLLNSGSEGLKVVFDTLNSSQDAEQDKKILKGAIDHINYDEDTEKFLKDTVAKSNNPALRELAENALASFAKDESEAAAEMTPNDDPEASDDTAEVDGGITDEGGE